MIFAFTGKPVTRLEESDFAIILPGSGMEKVEPLSRYHTEMRKVKIVETMRHMSAWPTGGLESIYLSPQCRFEDRNSNN